MLIYYYLKLLKLKSRVPKLYLTPFKVILRKNHFKLYVYDIEKICVIKIVKIEC